MKLEQARSFALGLPETSEEPHFTYTSFRVKGKIFATAPPEGLYLHVFVDEHHARARAAQDPKAYELLHWGKSLAGLRVTLVAARKDEVCELLEEAWRRKAPKTLAARGAVSPSRPAPTRRRTASGRGTGSGKKARPSKPRSR